MKFKTILFAALLSSCTSNEVKPDYSARAEAYFQIGLSALKENKFNRASEAFLQAEKLEPRSKNYRMHRAISLSRMGENKQAEELLAPLCERIKYAGECWNNLSSIQLNLKKSKGARISALQALKSRNYNSKHLAWANLARSRMQKNQFSLAQKSLTKALRISPDHCPTRHLAIKNLLYLSKANSALNSSNESLIRCPRNWRSYAWKAYSYFKMGRIYDAQEQLRVLNVQFPEKDAQIYSQANIERLKAQMSLEEPPL